MYLMEVVQQQQQGEREQEQSSSMNESRSSAAARPTTRTEPQREREPEQLQLVPLWKSLPRKQRHGGETSWMMWPATAPSMETRCRCQNRRIPGRGS